MDKIPLKRLKDHKVKGNFTIYCENYTQYKQLEDFFHTDKSYIKFKDIANVPHEKQSYLTHLVKKWEQVLDYESTDFTGGKRLATAVILESKETPCKLKDTTKFIIIYESLDELLKLRDIFKVRSGRFDMKLIKKRNTVHFFTDDFYKEFDNLEISKIRT